METPNRMTIGSEMLKRNSASVTDLRKQSLFEVLDTQKTGSISRADFDKLYGVIEKEAEKNAAMNLEVRKASERHLRRCKIFACLAAVLGAFLLASMLANFVIVTFVVDSNIKTTTEATTGALKVKDSDDIVKTAIATEDLPLIVAPILDMDTLAAVKSLQVTYHNHVNEVTTEFAVSGVRKHNSTYVEFVSSIDCESVEMRNGEANLVRCPTAANDLVNTVRFPICSANASCSAFKASGVDADAAMAVALEELEKHGFYNEEAVAERRQLQPSSGSWTSFDVPNSLLGGSNSPGPHFANAKVVYHTGYTFTYGPRHVAFMLHHCGGNAASMYGSPNNPGASYTSPSNINLIFVYPTSSMYGGWHQGCANSGATSQDDYANTMMPQLANFMDKLENGEMEYLFADDDSGFVRGTGWEASGSRVFSFGVSDGSGGSMWSNLHNFLYPFVSCAGGTGMITSGISTTIASTGVDLVSVITPNDGYTYADFSASPVDYFAQDAWDNYANFLGLNPNNQGGPGLTSTSGYWSCANLPFCSTTGYDWYVNEGFGNRMEEIIWDEDPAPGGDYCFGMQDPCAHFAWLGWIPGRTAELNHMISHCNPGTFPTGWTGEPDPPDAPAPSPPPPPPPTGGTGTIGVLHDWTYYKPKPIKPKPLPTEKAMEMASMSAKYPRGSFLSVTRDTANYYAEAEATSKVPPVVNTQPCYIADNAVYIRGGKKKPE